MAFFFNRKEKTKKQDDLTLQKWGDWQGVRKGLLREGMHEQQAQRPQRVERPTKPPFSFLHFFDTDLLNISSVLGGGYLAVNKVPTLTEQTFFGSARNYGEGRVG